MKRRRFLARGLQGLVLGASSLSALEAIARDLQSRPASAEAGISAGQWKTLTAVLDHLLPSEPATKDQPFRPGARDVQATGYLKLVLRDPKLDPEDIQVLEEGVAALEERCLQAFQRGFPELSSSQKETLLRDFEKTEQGERWLGEMLDFLLEALLGDPSRGGNPDGLGWKWLGITPGFPLPPRASRD
jgi:gluconate 2-dehydrogenase gamma chain